MDITESSLFLEVKEAFDSGYNPVHYFYSGGFTLPDDEQVGCRQVLNLTYSRRYDTTYSDEVIMTVSISEEDYTNKLLPNKSNLTFTLYIEPVGERSEDSREDLDYTFKMYRAALIDSKDTKLEGKSSGGTAEADRSLREIDVQLIELSIEQLKNVSVGTIARDMVPGDVVRAIFTKISSELKMDTSNIVKGVDMVTPSLNEPREHTIIKPNTELMKLPQYVQENCGGIYGTGVGFYLQDNQWYFWPLYNTERYHTTVRTMTIINVPENRLPGIERSYVVDQTSLMVLSTGKVVHTDNSERDILNQGNGVRYIKAENMVEGSFQVVGNKAMFQRANNLMAISASERETGINVAKFADDFITDNIFEETAKITKRVGSNLMCTWENSEPRLVYPGMPIRYIYMEGEEIKTAHGVVLGSNHQIMLDGKGETAKRHKAVSVLRVFLGG